MRLFLRPKRFALTDTRLITDEAGQLRYIVKVSPTVRGNRHRLYDPNGTLLAQVLRPKPAAAFTHTRYTVYLKEQAYAEILEDGTYRWRFSRLGWTAAGDYREAAFRIAERGKPVLRVIGRPTYWGMAYDLDLPENDRQVLSIACGLAMICIFEAWRKRAAAWKARGDAMPHA